MFGRGSIIVKESMHGSQMAYWYPNYVKYSVSKMIINGSENDLSSGRRQVSIWINAGI